LETRLGARIVVQMKLSAMLDETHEQSITLDSGKHFEAEVIDISEWGLGLVIKKYYLPRGTSLELTMDGAPFELKKEIKLKAEIKYCKNYKANMYKCGVKIIEISKECEDAIKTFITKYEKRQKPRLDLM
jgi:c-di-GMP-binding flagellar brake protein YcgR